MGFVPRSGFLGYSAMMLRSILILTAKTGLALKGLAGCSLVILVALTMAFAVAHHLNKIERCNE